MNVKDVFPEKNTKKVMVIVDQDGDYITIGDEEDLLVIDKINNRDLNKLTIVSKSWFDHVFDEEDKTKSKPIPTGVNPEYTDKDITITPSFGVNGVQEED